VDPSHLTMAPPEEEEVIAGAGAKSYGSVNIRNEDVFEDEPLLASKEEGVERHTCSSLWRALIFGWFTPVLEHMQEQLDMGISPELEKDDKIPPLPEQNSTDYLTQRFQRRWEEEQRTADQPSLLRCLWKEFSPLFLQAGLLKFVHDCLQFVGPQVLNGLIVFLRSPTENMTTGIVLTLVVTVAQLLMSLCLRHYFFHCYMVSLRLRTCVLYAIFQKSLKMDPSYYQEHPVGQVTNLMSVDVQRLQDVIAYLHSIWYSFLQIGLAMYFLWQQLGPSCLAGVAVILASIPLTGITARWMGKLQKKVMKRKDDRIQVNQETLTNMKVVKLQAWEGPFGEKVTHLRKRELNQLLHYFLARSCTQLLWGAVPLMIAVATFAAYVVIAGQALDVATALTALALFQILRFPLFMLPNIINNLVEANVALGRIEGFLSAPEQVGPNLLTDNEKNVISLSNATFTYQSIRSPPKKGEDPSPKEQLEQTEKELLLLKARLTDAEEQVAQLEGRKPFRSYGSSISVSSMASMASDGKGNNKTSPEKMLCLRRVNFECKEGEFVVVVGSVGSGKSTLLRSVLGEVQLVSGETGVRGKVAYFDQKPFVMNDTVEGNILFGKPKDDEELYKEALACCSLKHDLELLPKGDQCEIGERGITLSGGQKARIAMARVVYHDADISLLDDCLSAVDAHVGRDLFDNCIAKTLMGTNSKNGRKRTVVLVTNALQYLSHPKVDRIVVLKNGMVVESGSYKELCNGENLHFRSFLQAFTDAMSGDYSDEATSLPGASDEVLGKPGSPEKPEAGRPIIARTLSTKKVSENSGELERDKGTDGKLMTDEMAEREIGQVGKDVYIEWAKAAGGMWVIFPLLLVYTANECMKVLGNWWLTYWSHAATPDSASQMHFLGIYALINCLAILADFLRTITILLLGLKASSEVSCCLDGYPILRPNLTISAHFCVMIFSDVYFAA
jgi:ATP-binding cassette subfamily C (CFTR/MRP) protein 1